MPLTARLRCVAGGASSCDRATPCPKLGSPNRCFSARLASYPKKGHREPVSSIAATRKNALSLTGRAWTVVPRARIELATPGFSEQPEGLSATVRKCPQRFNKPYRIRVISMKTGSPSFAVIRPDSRKKATKKATMIARTQNLSTHNVSRPARSRRPRCRASGTASIYAHAIPKTSEDAAVARRRHTEGCRLVTVNPTCRPIRRLLFSKSGQKKWAAGGSE